MTVNTKQAIWYEYSGADTRTDAIKP